MSNSITIQSLTIENAHIGGGLPAMARALFSSLVAGPELEISGTCATTEDHGRPAIGEIWVGQGGIYAGDFRGVGGTVYGLIVGKEEDIGRARWAQDGERDLSDWDGLVNTAALRNDCPPPSWPPNTRSTVTPISTCRRAASCSWPRPTCPISSAMTATTGPAPRAASTTRGRSVVSSATRTAAPGATSSESALSAMSCSMTEEWRGIPGWDGYEASSLGRIRSSNGVKAPFPDFKGYRRVKLWRHSKA